MLRRTTESARSWLIRATEVVVTILNNDTIQEEKYTMIKRFNSLAAAGGVDPVLLIAAVEAAVRGLVEQEQVGRVRRAGRRRAGRPRQPGDALVQVHALNAEHCHSTDT